MASNTYETVYNALMQSIEDRKTGFDQKTVDFKMTFKDLTKELDASKKQIEAFKKSMVQQLNDKDDEIKKINADKQAEITRLLTEHANALTTSLSSTESSKVENIKKTFQIRYERALQQFKDTEKTWMTQQSNLNTLLSDKDTIIKRMQHKFDELQTELLAQDTTQKQSFQNSPDHENAQAALQGFKELFIEKNSIIEALNEKLKNGNSTDLTFSDLLYQYNAFFTDIGNFFTTFKIMRNEESQRNASKAGKERPIIYEKGVPRYENICRKTTGLYGISEESLIASDKATCVPKEFFVIDT